MEYNNSGDDRGEQVERSTEDCKEFEIGGGPQEHDGTKTDLGSH